MEQQIIINQDPSQSILINSNEPQLIEINNLSPHNIEISTSAPQNINIAQPDNQLIYIDGAGAVIGITDVLVNGISVVSGNIAYILVPTKTSELINDSGYITNETDPTVPSIVKSITLADINNWNNKQDTLVSGSNIKTINNNSILGNGNLTIEDTLYTAGTGININENNIISNTITSYNDLTELPTIPTKTSELINDSDFVTENDLAEVALTGSYNSLSDTPIIPDSTSQLTNDSDYVTSSEVSTEIQTAISTKQDTLVSGTNIKTINNNSILGSGNLTISGGGGGSTDVQINGTSIVSNDVANIITESAYNSSTNKIATKNDIPTQTSQLTNNSNFAVTNANNNFSSDQTINSNETINGLLFINIPTNQYSGIFLKASNYGEASINFVDNSGNGQFIVGYNTGGSDKLSVYTPSTGSNVFNLDRNGNLSTSGYVRANSGVSCGGDIWTDGHDLCLTTSGSGSNDSGDIVFQYGNGREKCRLWTDNNYSSMTGLNYREYDENGNWLGEGRVAIAGRVLYDNSNGNNSTVDLNDGVQYYKYIDIFYKQNQNLYSSVRIYDPNYKNASLLCIGSIGSGGAWLQGANVYIQGTQITRDSSFEARLGTTTYNQNNNIYIVKVIGYKI